jgi:hypothetical protein
MKVTGIALAVLGGLMILSGLNLGVTKYDLHSSHDISKFTGGLAISVMILAGGILLIRKSNRPT